MRQKRFSAKQHGVSVSWIASVGCLLLAFCLTARPAGRLVKRQVLAWQAADTWRAWQAAGKESASGDPLVWLTANSADISTLVLDDATKENLARFPCWVAFGAKPADQGLKIIQAHRDTHFRNLDLLEINDTVRVDWTSGARQYQVIDIEIVNPQQAEARFMELAAMDRLVLLTCYPFRYVGPAPQRYLVWLQGSASEPQR